MVFETIMDWQKILRREVSVREGILAARMIMMAI